MRLIQAARMGKKVVLISQNSHVMAAYHIGAIATDMNRNTLVGGIAREFYQNIYKYYQELAAWRVQNQRFFLCMSRRRTYTGEERQPGKCEWCMNRMLLKKYFSMLKEAGVAVVLNEQLQEKKKAGKSGTNIKSITMKSGSIFTGRIFIDASYEGDLMASCGVSYFVEEKPIHNTEKR